MLYATEGITSDADFNKAMVGVASVWYVWPFLILCSLNLYDSGTKETRRCGLAHSSLFLTLQLDATNISLDSARKSKLPYTDRKSLVTNSAPLESAMVSAWAHAECHTLSNPGT